MDTTELVLDQKEVCRLLRISRPTFYRLIKDKELEHIRLGRKVFVTRVQLERLLNSGCPPAKD
jgi:excisionase family DNA binding protein